MTGGLSDKTKQKQILIAGGGTAGTIVANRLARLLQEEILQGRVCVQLLTDSTEHLYQPGFFAVAFNEFPLTHFVRAEADLLHPAVRWRVDQVERVDLAGQRVEGQSGRTFRYDLLVLATGAHPAPLLRALSPTAMGSTAESRQDLAAADGSALDGGAHAGVDGHAVDGETIHTEAVHTLYTVRGARRLRQALARFKQGRLVVLVDTPHKCPAAPPEFMLMLEDWLRQTGRRHQAELVYVHTEGQVHPWPEVAEWAEGELARRGVRVVTGFRVERLDLQRHRLSGRTGSADGAGRQEYEYDLLVHVPVHHGAAYVRASGLSDSGFLTVRPDTLQLLSPGGHLVENVYALGDGADLPVSKAGATAHYQANVVAANVAASAQGRPASYRYDGKEVCLVRTAANRYLTMTKDYEHPARLTQDSEILVWAKRGLDELYWALERGVL